ncbi:FecR domain-containing protein [Hyalangium sp.]|uniref:FecR domain-containing protein n=1 Tax=Hyalangium sp. TaxID=2028555 RepID=UPI002D32BEB9|nr:FecR domain-containing protein [Hyalangium sp.]HYH99057.1 FecR domain-containing protein [Hyalangium sp.]
MARHETEALWAFASDELKAEERARVAEHVAGCAECTRKLVDVRQAQSLLRTVQTDAPAVRWSEVDDRIQTAAARKLARLERQPRWPWALVTVGALAAVLAFVVLRPVAPLAPSSAPVAVREERPAPVSPEIHEVPAPAVEPSPAPAVEPPQAPVLATHVESASGAWIREPDVPERSLVAGAQLRSGASVRTRAKSSALLRLPDASRVRLSPDSEVTLARTEAQDVHLTVTRGRLAVQASHAARQGFTVEAAGVRASVVGTVFSVECTPSGAVVAVSEGKVRVEAKGQLPRFVSAGERLEVRSAQRTTRTRALSARDRQAFLELGSRPVEAAAPSRPTGRAAETTPDTAVPTEPAPSAGAAPEETPPPVAGAPSSGAEASGSELPPYPVPTSPEPVEPGVLASSPSTSDVGQGLPSPSPWEPPEPGAPMQGTADARFLWHARDQLHAKTCESFLVGLAEIAERSAVREFREQARYLRARCFEERLAPAEATAEYRRYLREFPKGRYVREAKAALLP